MVSRIFYEEDATLYSVGSGTPVVSLKKEMLKVADIDPEEDKSSLKIGVGESDKYGRFIFVYSTKKQKKYQKQKAEEKAKEQQKEIEATATA